MIAPIAPRIATPVSHLFEDDATRAALSTLSDALELRDHPKPPELAAEMPLLYHSDQSVLVPLDVERVLGVFRAYADDRIRLVSFHAPCCYERPVLSRCIFQPGGRRLERDEMLDHARRNAEALRNALPDGVALLVENNNYFPTPAYDTVTEPEFLRELIDVTDFELLLDLPHACITAGNTGRPSSSYIEELPVERVAQLHFSGYETSGEAWRDTHEEPTADQWSEAMDWMRKLERLRWISLEYYRDAAVLQRMLCALRGEIEEGR